MNPDLQQKLMSMYGNDPSMGLPPAPVPAPELPPEAQPAQEQLLSDMTVTLTPMVVSASSDELLAFIADLLRIK